MRSECAVKVLLRHVGNVSALAFLATLDVDLLVVVGGLSDGNTLILAHQVHSRILDLIRVSHCPPRKRFKTLRERSYHGATIEVDGRSGDAAREGSAVDASLGSRSRRVVPRSRTQYASPNGAGRTGNHQEVACNSASRKSGREEQRPCHSIVDRHRSRAASGSTFSREDLNHLIVGEGHRTHAGDEAGRVSGAGAGGNSPGRRNLGDCARTVAVHDALDTSHRAVERVLQFIGLQRNQATLFPAGSELREVGDFVDGVMPHGRQDEILPHGSIAASERVAVAGSLRDERSTLRTERNTEGRARGRATKGLEADRNGCKAILGERIKAFREGDEGGNLGRKRF